MIRILSRIFLLSLCLLSIQPAEGNKKTTSKLPAQSAQSLYDDAEAAYMNYDFKEAATLIASARKKMKKGDDRLLEDIEDLERRITLARNFIGRVENLQILDSISVPADAFFKAYRLHSSAGSLGGTSTLPPGVSGSDYVFTNENGEYKIWSALSDSAENLVLYDSTLLTDGSWSKPEELIDLSDENGNSAWPFMMADGVTLYYATDGPESMGGYDIMVATRDASDGSFLQPQNLGMPYNSPYDDYLLAIDELNGVGWWATDRNRLDDMVTIYLYKLNDIRTNYDADLEDIEDKARITDWKSTQDSNTDYSELLASIRAINPDRKAKRVDFRLPMDNGIEYVTFTDFKSKTASQLMRKYVTDKERYDRDLEKLESLRHDYYNRPSQALKKSIQTLEKQTEELRQNLKQRLSDIYRSERKQE